MHIYSTLKHIMSKSLWLAHFPEKIRPRCYAELPTAQNTFQQEQFLEHHISLCSCPLIICMVKLFVYIHLSMKAHLPTCSGQIQLSTDNLCICNTPEVITYGAPHPIGAHFYSAFHCCPSTHQPQITSHTGGS